jgi:formate hydrogenlyase subunit 6/NADH:ubiquinone oxidoreductase subunit I
MTRRKAVAAMHKRDWFHRYITTNCFFVLGCLDGCIIGCLYGCFDIDTNEKARGDEDVEKADIAKNLKRGYNMGFEEGEWFGHYC